MDKKILIVDDDTLFSQSLREILSSRGYEVTTVTTAQEALTRINEDYEVWIIDLKLPDKDGLELAEEIKTIKFPPPIIIILTGFSSLPAAKKAIALKADAYLEKPIDPDRLFLTLYQLLKEKEVEGNCFNYLKRILEKANIPAAVIAGDKIIFYNHSFPIEKGQFFNFTNINDLKIGNQLYRLVTIPVEEKVSLIFLINISDKEGLIEEYQTIFSYLPFKIYLVKDNYQVVGQNKFCYQIFKNYPYPCSFFGETCLLLQAETSKSAAKALKIIEGRHWEENCLPLKNNQFLLFFIDKSEEIEKNRELFLATEEWEKTFNAINDMIVIIDKNFNILKVNKAVYQFFHNKKLIGKKCHEIFHQKEEPIINCPFVKTLRIKTSFTEEIEIDGQTFIVSVSPIFDEKGEVERCVHIARNITNLKIIEKDLREKTKELTILNQELQNSQRELIKTAERLAKTNEELVKLSNAKTEFVQILSHEMRTPLTAILEGSNLLYENCQEADTKKLLQLIRNNAQKLFELINDLLDLTKIESGRIELLPQAVDINKIFSQLINNLQVIAKEKGLKIIKEIDEKIPLAFVDENSFYRIIVNLLSNAVKYSKENGEIWIRAFPHFQQKKIIISIKDNGIGIPKSEQHKVFQKFAQIVHPGYQPIKGTGLGLALVKELVERSGGSIWFESEEHKGTTFYFTVPIYDEEEDFQYYKQQILKKAKELNLALGIFWIKKEREDFKKEEKEILKNLVKDFIGETAEIKNFNKKIAVMAIGKEEELKKKFKKFKKSITQMIKEIVGEEQYEKDFDN